MLHLAFHHLPLCAGFQNRCVKVISTHWTPASGQYTCHVEYAPARRWGHEYSPCGSGKSMVKFIALGQKMGPSPGSRAMLPLKIRPWPKILNVRIGDNTGFEGKPSQSGSRKPALNSGRPATAVLKA